jgi:hypothetical protein
MELLRILFYAIGTIVALYAMAAWAGDARRSEKTGLYISCVVEYLAATACAFLSASCFSRAIDISYELLKQLTQ